MQNQLSEKDVELTEKEQEIQPSTSSTTEYNTTPTTQRAITTQVVSQSDSLNSTAAVFTEYPTILNDDTIQLMNEPNQYYTVATTTQNSVLLTTTNDDDVISSTTHSSTTEIDKTNETASFESSTASIDHDHQTTTIIPSHKDESSLIFEMSDQQAVTLPPITTKVVLDKQISSNTSSNATTHISPPFLGFTDVTDIFYRVSLSYKCLQVIPF